MNRLAAIGMALAVASGAGCAHRTLHPSHGETYHALFGAQIAAHETRPLAPMSGDEAQGVMQAYRAGLSGEHGAGAGAGGGGGVGMQMPTMPNLASGGGGAGQPGGSVNFKVR